MSTESSSAPQPVGHQGARVEITQHRAPATSGWLGVVVLAACAYGIVLGSEEHSGLLWLPIVVLVLVAISLEVLTPGQTAVVQFFGRYIGTIERPGFWLLPPFTVRKRVSVRVRNFETNHLKVNDADGNPVEIAAIVVWQVVDTAKSTYAVESYLDFVSVQAESALRDVASGQGTSLRGSTDVVAAELAREVAARVAIAGVEIVEVRISHLAYSPEIAQAMLRRQQANAVVAASSRSTSSTNTTSSSSTRSAPRAW